MDRHLVAVEVSAESLADERTKLQDLAELRRQRHRSERLDAVSVKGWLPIQDEQNIGAHFQKTAKQLVSFLQNRLILCGFPP
jgi:hypothetical protein